MIGVDRCPVHRINEEISLIARSGRALRFVNVNSCFRQLKLIKTILKEMLFVKVLVLYRVHTVTQ